MLVRMSLRTAQLSATFTVPLAHFFSAHGGEHGVFGSTSSVMRWYL